jgi:plastocyanin
MQRPLAALLTVLLGAATAASAPATTQGQSDRTRGRGTIAGRVTLTRVRGTPLPSNVYPRRTVGILTPPQTPEIRNVVVYLDGVASPGALPPGRHEIRQEREMFVPRVLAVTRGSRVDFPNADPFFHNVFSLSGAANFDLGRYPPGQSRSRTFTKPGLVKVYCHIHSHMTATVLVLDHPYFTTPELDGRFALPDVPPGTYRVVGWHERVGERTDSVQVQAGTTVFVDFSLPVEDSP